MTLQLTLILLIIISVLHIYQLYNHRVMLKYCGNLLVDVSTLLKKHDTISTNQIDKIHCDINITKNLLLTTSYLLIIPFVMIMFNVIGMLSYQQPGLIVLHGTLVTGNAWILFNCYYTIINEQRIRSMCMEYKNTTTLR